MLKDLAEKNGGSFMKQWFGLLMAAILFAWTMPANAEEGAFEKLGRVCGEEVEALCPDVTLGEGRVLECLEKNQDKISKECYEATVEAQKKFEHQALAA
jgi:Cysteine rich repeat